MRPSTSQTFSSPTPQPDLEEQKLHAKELQERERILFLTLQGRRPTLSSTPTQSLPLNQKQQFTYTYQSPRPRSQIEALPPSSTPVTDTTTITARKCTSTLEEKMKEFMELQRDPARRHPMFFTDAVRRAPNGVVVGEGVGRGFVFGEEGREGGEGRGRL